MVVESRFNLQQTSFQMIKLSFFSSLKQKAQRDNYSLSLTSMLKFVLLVKPFCQIKKILREFNLTLSF